MSKRLEPPTERIDVQNILHVNECYIKTLLEYRSFGVLDRKQSLTVALLEELLHKNLVQLSLLADPTADLDALLPPPQIMRNVPLPVTDQTQSPMVTDPYQIYGTQNQSEHHVGRSAVGVGARYHAPVQYPSQAGYWAPPPSYGYSNPNASYGQPMGHEVHPTMAESTLGGVYQPPQNQQGRYPHFPEQMPGCCACCACCCMQKHFG